MLIFYVLLILFVLVSLLDNRLTLKAKKQIFVICGFILVLFAGLRDSTVDMDYKSYLYRFQTISTIKLLFSNPNIFFSQFKIEPATILIFSLVKSISSNAFPVVVFVFAFLSISLKMKAISKMSDYILFSVLIYFSTLFLLQDMTQIRAAVATGLVLLSIPAIIERNIWKFFTYTLLAICFHYSAIVFIPFYFFNWKKLNKTIYLIIILLPIILAVLHFSPLEILARLKFGVFSEKISDYLIGQAWNRRTINIFNLAVLCNVLLSLVYIFFSQKTENKYFIMLTKINCIGIALFYLFSVSPVIAFRTYDLVTSVQIILIPSLIRIVKPRALAEGIIILIAIALFLNQVLFNPIFNHYSCILF